MMAGARPGLVDTAGGVDAAVMLIIRGPGASLWLNDALTSALNLNPVEICNDAELLTMVLRHLADQITGKARAALDARSAIKRAQNNGG